MSRDRKSHINSNSIFERSFSESNSRISSDQIKISDEQISLLISAKQEIKKKISKLIKKFSQEIESFKTKFDQLSLRVIKKLKIINKFIQGPEDFQIAHLNINEIKSFKKKAKLITKNLNQAMSEDITLILNKLNEKFQNIKNYINRYRSSKNEIIQSCDLSHHSFDELNYKKKERNFEKIKLLKHEQDQLKIELHQVSTKNKEINKSIRILKNKKKDIDESNIMFQNYLVNCDTKVSSDKHEIKYLKKKSRQLNESKGVVENNLGRVADSLQKCVSLNKISLVPSCEIYSLNKIIRSIDVIFGELNVKLNSFEEKPINEPSILTAVIDFPTIPAEDKDAEKNLKIIHNLSELASYQKKKIEELEIELNKSNSLQENEHLSLSTTFYINYLEKSNEDLIKQIKTSGFYAQEYVDNILQDREKIKNEFLSLQKQFNNLCESYTTLYNLYYQINSTEIKISE